MSPDFLLPRLKIALVFFILIAFLSSASLLHANSDAPVFNAKTFTLENGMKAVLIENNRAPVITHMVWYGVGAVDEEEGQSGIAHYLEHLMFKGTDNVASGELSKIVKRLGGNDNAFTSQDYTAYFQTVASQHLERVMTLEADRMSNLIIPENEAESELQVVLEERRERIDNNPQAQFFMALRNALFRGHPYATPIIGWRDDIEGLSVEEAEAFYKKWYTPQNATLVVAGDVSYDEFKELTTEIYGEIVNTADPKRDDLQSITPLPEHQFVEMGHPLIQQPLYTRMHRAPSWGQNQKESFALQVLNEYLDGSEASPLYQTLVVDRKVATNVSFSYNSFALGPSTISLSAYPAPGIGFDHLNDEINAFLTEAINQKISEEELNKIITRLQDSSVFARDSVTGPAMLIGRALASNIPLEEIEKWPYLIGQVTTEDVQGAMKKYLNAYYVDGRLSPQKISLESKEEEIE